MSVRRIALLSHVFMALAICVMTAQEGRCVLVLGADPRLHDRFYVGPDKAYIAANQEWSRESDWSGIGRRWDESQTGITWWAQTLVSDNYVVTARHVRPSRFFDTSDELPPVRFYRYDDPDGEYWETTFEIAPGATEYTGFGIGNADIWFTKLSETPPDWVRRYPLVKRNQATNWISFIDPTIYIFGTSPPWDTFTSNRVGRNVIEHRSGGVYTYDTTSPPGLGADEARFWDLDSGYPNMAITPAGPSLYSISSNWGVGVTMLDYHQLIRDEMAARGEHVDIVTDLLGDLDADYDVDEDDLAILQRTLEPGERASYFNGDLNRDGLRDQADFDLMDGQVGKVLRAPADFTGDDAIDGADFSFISQHFLTQVAPFTDGDATGDGLVDRNDILTFDSNRIMALSGAAPRQIPGDANYDGVVNDVDLHLWAANLNRADIPEPYYIDGDVTGDNLVDFNDLAVIRDNFGRLAVDVNGDFRVNLADIDAVIENWEVSEPSAGDVDGDGVVGPDDLQAVGSSLGKEFRQPLPSRLAGIVPGDFTGDLYVGGADLLLWQRHLGPTFSSPADANKDGMVDDVDLEIWRTSLMAQNGIASTFTAGVPEACTSTLATAGLAMLWTLMRSSRKQRRTGSDSN